MRRRLPVSLRPRAAALATIAALLLALAGCATTTAAPGGESPRAGSRQDPWENWNRKVFAFNEALDASLVKPLATAYVDVVPRPVRAGVDNFINNILDAWSAVNSLLQGKLENGMNDIMRVAVNTGFGLGGLVDIAGELGFDHHYEDFGQTLGRWGMPPGPYIVWPLLGPSSLRESVALPLDLSASPAALAHTTAGRIGISTVQVVNTRAKLLGATRLVDDISLDKYVFVRDAYLQRRRSLVFDGDVPDDDNGADDAPKRDEREPERAPAR